MTSKVLGLDSSFYQTDITTKPWKRINWHKAYESGARFVWIRGGQGKYVDPCWEWDFEQSGEAGFMRGTYWFYEYRRGYDPGTLAQADILLENTKGYGGELGYDMDFEQPNNDWPALPPRATCYSIIEQFYAGLESTGAKADVFYTNWAGLIHMDLPDKFKKEKLLWLAWYPTLLWKHDLWLKSHLLTGIMPTLPKVGWTPTFWQFTDRLSAQKFGVTSYTKQIDGDYFFGSMIDLQMFANGLPTPRPTPEPPPQGEDDVVKVKFIALVNGQNIRVAPTTNSTSIGSLPIGTVLTDLIDIAFHSSTNVWLKFRNPIGGVAEGWVALEYGGKTYLRQQQ